MHPAPEWPPCGAKTTRRSANSRFFSKTAWASFLKWYAALREAGSRSWLCRLLIPRSAFVRFLLSHPEQGREILERAGLALIESDLIGVELPEGPQPLLQDLHGLAAGGSQYRASVSAAGAVRGHPAVALMVDNIELAQETLASEGLPR